jgi:hypothetical protein
MSLINVDLSDTINSWRTKTNQIATNLGDIASLNDSAVNIVSAINSSIASNVVALNASIATLTSNTDSDVLELKTNVFGAPLTLGDLDTTDKSSIVAAINELDRRSIDVYNSSGTLLNS